MLSFHEDDEEDEKMAEALPELPSFTAKDDPEFTIPVADVPVVPARTSSRPQRYYLALVDIFWRTARLSCLYVKHEML